MDFDIKTVFNDYRDKVYRLALSITRRNTRMQYRMALLLNEVENLTAKESAKILACV
ncbi:MAG: hypothetical protein WC301_00665 [Candidatus Omnitrophota bacterium]|jgi:hypothetical protein